MTVQHWRQLSSGAAVAAHSATVAVMVMGIRVAGDKEGKRDEAGDGVGDVGGVWSATKRAMALAARAMATGVAGN